MFASSHSNTNSDAPIIPVGGGYNFRLMAAPITPSTSAVVVTALAGLALAAVIFYGASSGRLKSPWSHKKRKHALSPQEWKILFTQDGRLRDGAAKFLKRVRSGGVDPTIRAEVWPFLLGVYDLDSTKEERDVITSQNRKEYEKIRRQCQKFLKHNNGSFKLNKIGGVSNQGDGGVSNEGDSGVVIHDTSSLSSEDVACARESLSEERSPNVEYSDDPSSALVDGDDVSNVNNANTFTVDSNLSDSDSSESSEVIQNFPYGDCQDESDPNTVSKKDSLTQTKVSSKLKTKEDFATWQRIIRLDAVRANTEWIPYSPSQAEVSKSRAQQFAEVVGLTDYGQLEPCRVFHAARLVAILEAYALYDPEIGYCQGMSDLLSPLITVVSEDYMAFWCFVGFMKKARQNFRLDEDGGGIV
ncbi:hypothetical protein K1719_014771 [Acacia pycnantha]|nr:hypothetical protein K1719_014771 [Acacia pycnantha]